MNDWTKRLVSGWNALRFALRSRLRIRLGRVRLKPAPKDRLYPDIATKRQERELLTAYDFQRWHELLGLNDYRLNLYHLDLLRWLQPVLAQHLPRVLRIVDVGSRTFYYAPALFHFFRRHYQVESLLGIELDAYRRYPNGFTAYDYAQAYLRELGESGIIRYEALDFMQVTASYNVCTLFLPFVTQDPLLHWGLPLGTFQPARLIAHAFDQLEQPGVLIVTNKGPEEQQTLHRLLREAGIPFADQGPFTSAFYAYDIPRYVTLVMK
ncbi:hypothetical protein ACFFSY_12720 [Paenibacillus aurantiacus]|uniref:Class I SAM-dependent methyltransferase n=1 Tax=Paenibacillus aurantiacus TaxID=1936118 RepID=A0ABV5KNL0_9BACL